MSTLEEAQEEMRNRVESTKQRISRLRNRDKKKYRTVRMRMSSQRCGAIKLGREWKLSFEQHQSLVLSSCHYCGTPPAPTNGIDRMDNQVGYIPKNCVPCCWPCNRMKGPMTYTAFIRRCQMIRNHIASQPDTMFPLQEPGVESPRLVRSHDNRGDDPC